MAVYEKWLNPPLWAGGEITTAHPSTQGFFVRQVSFWEKGIKAPSVAPPSLPEKFLKSLERVPVASGVEKPAGTKWDCPFTGSFACGSWVRHDSYPSS
jgi:hypothetical protein